METAEVCMAQEKKGRKGCNLAGREKRKENYVEGKKGKRELFIFFMIKRQFCAVVKGNDRNRQRLISGGKEMVEDATRGGRNGLLGGEGKKSPFLLGGVLLSEKGKKMKGRKNRGGWGRKGRAGERLAEKKRGGRKMPREVYQRGELQVSWRKGV